MYNSANIFFGADPANIAGRVNQIIPEFCFGCFKVQVELTTFIDLVKLTSLFYKLDFEEDLTKKTMIELRPNISG